jgi:protein-disulfide isomerase
MNAEGRSSFLESQGVPVMDLGTMRRRLSPTIRKIRFLADLLVTIAALTAAGAVIWAIVANYRASHRAVGSLHISLRLDDTPRAGNPLAPLVLVEFSDFECPYCRRFAQEVWPELRARFIDTGRLQVSFRHLPLPIHPHARRLAAAADCAQQQQRFWPMADSLFANNAGASEQELSQYAEQSGLALNVFVPCMTNGTTAHIDSDIALARRLKITGTPTFLIARLQPDGQASAAGIMYGALPISQFEKAIDALER